MRKGSDLDGSAPFCCSGDVDRGCPLATVGLGGHADTVFANTVSGGRRTEVPTGGLTPALTPAGGPLIRVRGAVTPVTRPSPQPPEVRVQGWLERRQREQQQRPAAPPQPGWATERTQEQPTVNPWAGTPAAAGDEPEPPQESATTLDNRSPHFRSCGTDWPPANSNRR